MDVPTPVSVMIGSLMSDLVCHFTDDKLRFLLVD